MNRYFNNSVVVNNPLRIFFLCGSTYKKNNFKIVSNGIEREISDKRKVLKSFIEQKGRNFKTVILEENFMFSDDRSSSPRKKLNYKNINLNSLKSIELLTSLFSDYILIVHESFSTAAEIGMFSTSQLINNKLIVLTPKPSHTDEEYISGFMNLAYQKSSKESRIKFIPYNPGIYNFHISERVRKLHTYFIGNNIEGSLAEELSNVLDSLDEMKVEFNPSVPYTYRKFHSFYRLGKTNISIVLNSNDLICYIISLFNISDFVKEFRSEFDVKEMRNDTQSNRYKFLFKKGKNTINKYLKNLFYNTIKIENPNLDETYQKVGDAGKIIKFSLNYDIVKFDDSLGYFLYVLYALNFLNINSEINKFIISNDFIPVYKEYEKVIANSVRNKEKWWTK